MATNNTGWLHPPSLAALHSERGPTNPQDGTGLALSGLVLIPEISHWGQGWEGEFIPIDHLWSWMVRSAPPNHMDWNWDKRMLPQIRIKLGDVYLAGRHTPHHWCSLHCFCDAFWVPPILRKAALLEEGEEFLEYELLSIYTAGFSHLMGPFPYPGEGPEMCLPIIKHWDVWILCGLALSVFMTGCSQANSSPLGSR